jgi:hypothetical protein
MHENNLASTEEKRQVKTNLFTKITRLRTHHKAVLIGLILLLIGTATTIYLVQTQKELRGRGYTNGINLSFSSSKSTVAPNEEFKIQVLMDTKTLAATGAELSIAYPASIEVLSVQPGSFLSTVLYQPTIEVGKVTIALGSGITAVSGAGVLTTITLRAISPDTATISFDPTTQLTAKGVLNQNVLEQAQSLSVTIAALPTATPVQPTATSVPPTSTPTPTPTQIALTPTSPITDTIPPTVTITNPLPNERVNRKNDTPITVTALDSNGISQITLSVNGVLIKTCTNMTSCSTTYKFPRGLHTITSTAKDKVSNMGTTSTTITSR